MKIFIYSNDFEITEALREYIYKKLNTSFSSLSPLINKVEIRLSDENGPKGGKDKTCSILIRLFQSSDILVKDTEYDAYNAISRAITRSKRTMRRRIKLKQMLGRQDARVEYS